MALMYYVSCAFIGVLAIHYANIEGSASLITERTETMIEKRNQKSSADWINQLDATLTKQHGTFTSMDAHGIPLMLEWEKVDPQSPRINEIIKEAAEILAYTYATMELQFARTYPELVATEMFLKPLSPLFAHCVDHVDWNAAEDVLRKNLMQFFTTTDFAKYGKAQDVHLFVLARDPQTKTLLGVINYIGSKEFEYGSLKVAYFGVTATAVHRGIDQMLMSTIFKLVPEVTRLFLHTRITNQSALSTYSSWGFSQFPGPLAYWTDMEYLTTKSDMLQKTADTLKQ